MEPTPQPPSDPVEGFLKAPASPALDPLRQKILSQTTGYLRRRRWTKRFALAGGLAACYLAGILTVPFLSPRGESPLGQVVRKSEPPSRDQGPTPLPSPKRPLEDLETPIALEWKAVDNPMGRAENYRLAGDLYLAENDVESALRCYRGALASASPGEVTISPEDNWVLLIAKQEHSKEKNHAKRNS